MRAPLLFLLIASPGLWAADVSWTDQGRAMRPRVEDAHGMVAKEAGLHAMAYPPELMGVASAAVELTGAVAVRCAPGQDPAMAAAARGFVVSARLSWGDWTIWSPLNGDPLAGAQAAGALVNDGIALESVPVAIHQRLGKLAPGDPLIASQWHLGTGTGGINAAAAWDKSTGSGVIIGVLDSGLDYTHPDLSPKYRADLSRNFVDQTSDPQEFGDSNHGTFCAGAAAASGGNGLGGAGVAFNAGLAGLRILGGNGATNAQIAEALQYMVAPAAEASTLPGIGVYNNSWGPADDGKVTDGPDATQRSAVLIGITTGRGGRGAIYLWACGNGGDSGDSCDFDGYSNQRYSISVASCGPDGTKASYSEAGVGVFVVAPGGEFNGGGFVSTMPGNKYSVASEDKVGTSFACPVVSGVATLLVSRRPELTWRDVRHILATTTAQSTASDGKLVHTPSLGFGRVDADKAVSAVDGWTLVPAEATALTALATLDQAISDAGGEAVSTTLDLSAAPADYVVEHVNLRAKARHASGVGQLTWSITSPAGTKITTQSRAGDVATTLDWDFGYVGFLGENAKGTWTIAVTDVIAGGTGTVDSVALTINGHQPYLTPAITGIAGASAGATEISVTLAGSGLAKNASGLVPMTQVEWNGTIYQARVISDTRLLVRIPVSALTAGTAQVALVQPALRFAPGSRSATVAVTTSTSSVTAYGNAPTPIDDPNNPPVAVNPVTAFVTRFYQQCLSREPDAGGLTSWTGALTAKTQSGTDVARGFVLSPEFTNRNLDDEAFLDVLYQAFFNRAADAGGKAVWMAELGKGVLREDVLYGFIGAQEFTNLCGQFNIVQNSEAGTRRQQVRQFVRRNYQQYLGREPDAGGIASWVQALLDGTQTGGDVTKGFGTSQEYLNKGSDNSLFLDTTYKAFFDRDADTGGKTGWLDFLTSGKTRAEVIDGFIKAQEFAHLCAKYGIVPFKVNG